MKATMKARAAVRENYSTIFLLLAVAGITFVLLNMKVLEIHHEVNVTIITQGVSAAAEHRRFCNFQPLSPPEALEERLLLDSIAWPETPLLPDPLSVEPTSDPAHSTFTILPGRGGGQWHVGDQLEVLIQMSDFKGHPKKSGGDVFLARLHNWKLGAGVAGQVVDHLNGSYSAVFSLLWEGSAHIQVTMVHPSEAVTVLNRLTTEQPDRMRFNSVFRSGSVSETVACNVCLHPTEPLCNYTDVRTGEPWFCYKPKKLSCDARIRHLRAGITHNIKANEMKLFQSGVNLKVFIQASGPASVTVLPQKKGQPEVKSSSVTSGPSGYYYQGAWRALDGTTVQQFNISVMTRCLKGKVVHMFGDSTIRQWFEFLNAALPDLKDFDLHGVVKVGPYMALDYANNILVTFRVHGPPLHFTIVPISELRYIASEIDGVAGGTNTVVVFGIWAHFSTFPMEVYIRRLQCIRKAVVRLLHRAPGTLVVIRTANPKELSLPVLLSNSDWYALQRDKVLRAVFKGLNVHLIDAWEMVLAHNLPHNLHPQPAIVKNMIDLLVSYICPQKGD